MLWYYLCGLCTQITQNIPASQMYFYYVGVDRYFWSIFPPLKHSLYKRLWLSEDRKNVSSLFRILAKLVFFMIFGQIIRRSWKNTNCSSLAILTMFLQGYWEIKLNLAETLFFVFKALLVCVVRYKCVHVLVRCRCEYFFLFLYFASFRIIIREIVFFLLNFSS